MALGDDRHQRVIPVDIEVEMKKSFIDYAMSVIADRALPDVRDGLKPVHRRILYSMQLLNFTSDKAHRKCATTVGEVLGKFHPHGDAAVYDSLVRLAQDFSLRYPLVDGHGNFGSRDGDSPAAMRYTEARLAKISSEMLADINKDTVDFKPNYDEHEMEPVVLPARFPNLLANGSSGIAVGMATNIPSHNLNEIIDGVYAIIDNPDITIEELNKIIKGPDFPTAGIIVGRSGIRDAYKTGKGRIVVRSRSFIEQVTNTKQRIIITELPYQVNKARVIEKIADLVKDKRLEGIADINDESDRTDPVRIVIDLKRDVNANVILNQLFKFTQLQETFSANMLALVQVDGKFEPRVLNLHQMLDYYLEHQQNVIRRRTKFELERAEARAHILEGLKIALDHLDEVINIIRSSKTEVEAKERLSDRFGLSEKQSQAIVDMRLGRLTGLERDKIEVEYRELLEKIQYFRDVLANEYMVNNIIKEELEVIRNKYGDERRTEIIADEGEIDIDDLIQEEEITITLTHFGYVKRMPADTYKSQKRGGKGIIGLSTREEDFVKDIFITSSHDEIMFFTNKGRVYELKAYQIPESGRQAKGTAIVNLLQLGPGENVTTVIPIPQENTRKYIVMATRKGYVKKTRLEQYQNIRKSGLSAVTLRDDDELIEVRLTDGDTDIMLCTRNGISIRFNETDVRPMGRTAMGVIGIRLAVDDEVMSMVACLEDTTLLTVTEKGFGKRTEFGEYKVQNRAGKGVLNYRLTARTGKVIGAKAVLEDDDIMLISSDGTIIRMKVNEISKLGRVTQGVTLMRTSEGDSVVSLARVAEDEEEEEEVVEEENQVLDQEPEQAEQAEQPEQPEQPEQIDDSHIEQEQEDEE